MTIANIQLTRKLSSAGTENLKQSYYMSIVAVVEGTEDPSNIFVMKPADPAMGGAIGITDPQFINVANPVDYYELPTDSTAAKYLDNEINLQYTSIDVANEDWLRIQDDVEGLLAALRSEDTPLDDSLEETVIIG